MQVCNSPQTDNYASTPPLSFYLWDAFPVTQPTWQSTEDNVIVFVIKLVEIILIAIDHLQCSDAVGWAAGRASGL